MTLDEARDRIVNIERKMGAHTKQDKKNFEALEMAIYALELCKEEKNAHWDSVSCRCSRCGLSITYSEAVSGKYKYCYSCGAKMEEKNGI